MDRDRRKAAGHDHLVPSLNPTAFPSIFRFAADLNQFYISPRLVPPEGRLAIVTDAGRDAVDVGGALTNAPAADGEVVWS